MILFQRLKRNNANLAEILILLSLSIVWGASFILMKLGMTQEGNEVFSSTQVAALRLIFAFIVLSPMLWKYRKLIYSKKILYCFVVGFFGNGIPAFLFTEAEVVLDSSMAGILNSITPTSALLIAVLFFKQKVKWFNIFGMLIALISVSFLLGFEHVNWNIPIRYPLYVIAATVGYGISVNTIRNYLGNTNPVAISAFAFGFLGPICLIYLFQTDFVEVVMTNEKGLIALGYVAILGVFGTALALVIFNQLVQKTSVVFASSVTYIIPITAMLWGTLFGESIGVRHGVFTLCILIGTYFLNKK